MSMDTKITGERAMSAEGGFNPAWQRHSAEYLLAEPFLPPGTVLDLGCGVGHSYHLLAPRETVGVDIEPQALEGQSRRTVVADMRSLPFADGEFSSVLSSHSIEHVPDPERVVTEAARVVAPGGTVVIVTPNRLTFGRPDEIIDPYHFVEFDQAELRALCEPHFAHVEMRGLFGSDRYMELHDEERRKLDRLLRIDPLKLRRLMPLRTRQFLYDWKLARERRGSDPRAAAIGIGDFHLGEDQLDEALDLIAICTAGPR
ncbi:MAG: class I SAM-dependent methyltransferase [Solirubrobacterales bacterium]